MRREPLSRFEIPSLCLYRAVSLFFHSFDYSAVRYRFTSITINKMLFSLFNNSKSNATIYLLLFRVHATKDCKFGNSSGQLSKRDKQFKIKVNEKKHDSLSLQNFQITR